LIPAGKQLSGIPRQGKEEIKSRLWTGAGEGSARTFSGEFSEKSRHIIWWEHYVVGEGLEPRAIESHLVARPITDQVVKIGEGKTEQKEREIRHIGGIGKL